MLLWLLLLVLLIIAIGGGIVVSKILVSRTARRARRCTARWCRPQLVDLTAGPRASGPGTLRAGWVPGWRGACAAGAGSAEPQLGRTSVC